MNKISSGIGKAKGQIKESFRVTTTRPVAILMIVIGVFVFGMQSLNKLPLTLMPEITYPSLTVRTEWPGADPKQIEFNVSKRIESELAVVKDLVKISSISRSGMSDVVLEFRWRTDMNSAMADVREKLDQVFLPEDCERPLILRYDPTLDPIMRLAMFYREPVPGLTEEEMAMRLRDYAENELREKLESLEGVAAARVRGGLERELLVELNQEYVTKKKIDYEEVKRAVRDGNINAPSGDLRQGEREFQVRVVNEYENVDQIKDLTVKRRTGIDTKLRELTSFVGWHFKDREMYSRVNQTPSVEIQIFKEADANIVSVAAMVRDRVFGTPDELAQAQRYRQMRARLEGSEAPPQAQRGPEGGERGEGSAQAPDYLSFEVEELGWSFDLLTDQSIFIRDSIDEVLNNAVWGGLFAIIVLFLFLRNIKSTVLIGLSIPLSVVATFAPMMLFGVSLNIMSLGGLALGIGMLVDSSIVVLESIFRCREEGDSLVESVVRGTGEVGGAVTASTLTTIAVFFPIVFVEGVAGQVFGDLAMTVVFSLLASLLAALFFIPMLASRQIPLRDMEKRLAVERWDFAAARGVKERVKERFRSPRGLLGKAAAVVILVPLAAWWSIGAIPGTLYDLFIRRGQAWERFTTRTLGFWRRERGLLATPLKYVLFLPHHLFWVIVLAVAIVLDFLGRPLNSVEVAMERYASFGKRLVGKWMKFFWIIIGLPYYLVYLPVIFAVHFSFEVLGRLLGLMLLVAFKAVRVSVVVIGGIFMAILVGPFWLFGRFLEGLNHFYGTAISWSLRFRWAVVAIAVLIAVHAGTMVVGLRSNLIPELHQGEFNVRIKTPVGSDIERTNDLTEIVEQRIDRALTDAGGGKAYEAIATVVGAEKASNTRSDEGENTAVVTVRLKKERDIQAEEERAMSAIRSRIADIPGIDAVTFERPVLFSFKTPVEVEIKGPELERLEEYTNAVFDLMSDPKEVPGLIDLKNSIQPGNPTIDVIFDEDYLNLLGINKMFAAQLLHDLIVGSTPTKFREGDRQYDIRVRLGRDINIADINLRPTEEQDIPLGRMAAIENVKGYSEIRRVQQERTGLISANLSGMDLGTANEHINNVLSNEITWEPEYRYEITGQSEEMEVSILSLQYAVALAIFLVYIVMASQFESLLQPLIIIFTIPLALIGVVYMLQMTGMPVSIVVLLGVIMLAGIVVNNAIVLLDYINQLRARGLPKAEAIIEAGKVRLRPILMTTLTTVLGLLPLAMGLGSGAEIRSPMAWTVIAGLLSSTLLTLIVIPTVYSLIDRRKYESEEAPTDAAFD